MRKIRTEISIESNESLTIKRKRYSVRTFCEECKRISIMVLPTEAAFLSCQDIDSIVSLMYENQLHVQYIFDRGLYICLTSLCLFQFENEYTDLEKDKNSVKILADRKTNNYNFVNEE